MSDEMMFAIAKMPYEMAMKDELSRYQFIRTRSVLLLPLKRRGWMRSGGACCAREPSRTLRLYAAWVRWTTE